MVKVTFKTVQGKNFSLDFEDTTKISDVKKRIEEDQGATYPADNQVVIFQGKVLKDDTTLADNKVSENGFLVVMIQKAKAKPAAAAGASTSTAATPAPPAAAATPAAPASAAPTPAAPTPAAATAAPATAAATPAPAAAAAAPAAGGSIDYSTAASNLAIGPQLEATINSIQEMGFERAEIIRALRAAFNNPERAVEYLMTGIPAGVEQPQAAAPPPASAAPAAGAPAGAGAAAPQQPAAAAGPNAQPLDMFPQGLPGALSSAGGGGGGAPGPLDFLRQNPQFQALRHVVQANPQILQPMLQELGKQNPDLLQLINSNQQDFLRLINEPAEGGAPNIQDLAAQLGAAGGEGGLPPGAVQVHLTQAEGESIGRLEAMGFDRQLCLEAFLACDKNEEMAANYLLEHGLDDMM
ncbi:hypothetical protein WJX72_012290 [[Myrmecia] bisecta]|uniref:Ubiquitin receptor RAD23 n=1 Tax=[Myrmecia] bisecta TaxID=41462 RepID=A0AAW1PUU1_9CHLO